MLSAGEISFHQKDLQSEFFEIETTTLKLDLMTANEREFFSGISAARNGDGKTKSVQS